jgi:predicted dehydrogenase
VNLIQEVLGLPAKINGTLLKSIYSKGVDDAIFSLLTLDNEISGVLLVNWSDETYRKMSTSLTIQGKKGKIICDATEIKIFLREANQKEKLEKGWTIKSIAEFALPVNFYLRGEEYSAQIDYFVDNVMVKKQGTYNTFEQGRCTDKVMEMILNNAKLN